MTTPKLPEVPDFLPPAKEFERLKVAQTFWDFTGADGRPVSDSEAYKISEQIKQIPEWAEKIASVKKLQDEWNSWNELFPRWRGNIKTRLEEKTNVFRADDDSSSESQEIEWMRGRLENILWALKDIRSASEASAQEQVKKAQEESAKAKAEAEKAKAEAAKEKADAAKAKEGASAPKAAPTHPSSEAPKAEEPAKKKSGGDGWLLYAAIGLGAAALFFGGKKR